MNEAIAFWIFIGWCLGALSMYGIMFLHYWLEIRKSK